MLNILARQVPKTALLNLPKAFLAFGTPQTFVPTHVCYKAAFNEKLLSSTFYHKYVLLYVWLFKIWKITIYLYYILKLQNIIHFEFEKSLYTYTFLNKISYHTRVIFSFVFYVVKNKPVQMGREELSFRKTQMYVGLNVNWHIMKRRFFSSPTAAQLSERSKKLSLNFSINCSIFLPCRICIKSAPIRKKSQMMLKKFST